MITPRTVLQKIAALNMYPSEVASLYGLAGFGGSLLAGNEAPYAALSSVVPAVLAFEGNRVGVSPVATYAPIAGIVGGTLASRLIDSDIFSSKDIYNAFQTPAMLSGFGALASKYAPNAPAGASWKYPLYGGLAGTGLSLIHLLSKYDEME